MVIFLYDVYTSVWTEHGCLAYMVFALDLSNNGIEVVEYNVNPYYKAQTTT